MSYEKMSHLNFALFIPYTFLQKWGIFINFVDVIIFLQNI